MNNLDPGNILNTATAFWPSKVLLTAVEFDLFTVLSGNSMTAKLLGDTLGLHQRGWFDFFDTLVEVLNGKKCPDDQDIQKILTLFEE